MGSMEQVIDAIGDAVSTLILFSVEAEENNTVLTNLDKGTLVIQQCVELLLGVVEENANKIKDEPDIQNRMLTTCGDIRTATSGIVTTARALTADPMNKNAKRNLLEVCKNLLQGTVKELHVYDKYTVYRIIRSAERAVIKVDETNRAKSIEQINAVARELANAIVEVCQGVAARAKEIPDPVLKNKLLAANQNLKTHSPRLIKSVAESLPNPNDMAKSLEHSQIASDLKSNLREIIDLVDESNRTMFDALDLDFAVRPQGKSIPISHLNVGEGLIEAVRAMREALARGDAQGVAYSIQGITDAISALRKLADNTENPELKAKVLKAIAELEAIKDQLLPLSKKALAGDKAAMAQLQGLLNRAEQIGREMETIQDWDELWRAMRNTDDLLLRFEDAIRRGDLAEAERLKAQVEESLRRELEILERLSKAGYLEPGARERIEEIRRRLRDLQQQWSTLASQLLRDPTNKELLARLAGVADAIRVTHGEAGRSFAGSGGAEYVKAAKEYAQRAEEAKRRAFEAAEAEARNKRAPVVGNIEILEAAQIIDKAVETKTIDEATPEGRVFGAMQRVADEMRLLAAACERGDKAEIIKIAMRIQGHVKGIQKNADEVASKTKDPKLAEDVLGCAAGVQSVAIQLKVITAVKAASPTNDGTVKAQLVKCAKQLSGKLVATCNAVDVASIRFEDRKAPVGRRGTNAMRGY